MRALIECNTPVRTHVDHALSRAAASGQLCIYGVSRQEERLVQHGKGSDVQQLAVRPPRANDERLRSFFAYGSLMWEPALPFVTRRTPAVLRGFRRRLCLFSWTYRGTRDAPGLVLGLEEAEGASCAGYALHVCREDEKAALEYFDQRELINQIYTRRSVAVTAAGGVELNAHAYVADKTHAQYCGALTLERAATLVATGEGSRGTAFDYLSSTMDALQKVNVCEPALERVLERARAIRGSSPCNLPDTR